MSASLDALDPQLRCFVEAVCRHSAQLAAGHALDWPQRRQIAEAVRAPWRAGGPQMAAVQEHRIDAPAGTYRLRVYRPAQAPASAPALLYLHGGGWCLFSVDTHDRLMREYAAAAGVVVVGIDYALAPEHPYPAALEQSVHSVAWLREHAHTLGVDAQRLALGGDSAGAQLALATALCLRDRQALRGVGALLLNYGAFDPHIDPHTAAALGGADAMLSAAEMDEFWRSYLGQAAHACRDPLARPLLAALHALPPALLLWGDRDVLGEQSVQMAQRLAASGVAVEQRAYPGAPHSFLEAMSVSAQARDAVAAGAGWLRRHLHAGSGVDSRENDA